VSNAARLSRLLFIAREDIEMYADVVEARMGPGTGSRLRRDVAEIDAYRAERGWSPHGFGGETDTSKEARLAAVDEMNRHYFAEDQP
jgi:hypothetical protein